MELPAAPGDYVFEMNTVWGLVLLVLAQAAALEREPREVTESFLRRHVTRSDCLSYPQFSIGPKVPGAFVEAEVTFDGKAVHKVTIVRGHALLNRSVQAFVRSWELGGIERDGPFRAKVHVYFSFVGGRWGDQPATLVLEDGSFVVEKQISGRGPEGCQRWVARKDIVRVLSSHDHWPPNPLRLVFVHDDQSLIDSTARLFRKEGVGKIRIDFVGRSESRVR